MGGGLLVAHVDDPDALGEAAVVDRQDVAAAQCEDVAHTGPAQGPGDQLPARQVGHREVRRLLSAT